MNAVDLSEIKERAEQGDATEQFRLGVMYATGEGAPEDDAEAVKWFRLAAKQGDVEAQFNLGVMYANGEGVPEDDAEAVKWFQLSAEQGHDEAQFSLGVIYRDQGVPEYAVEAIKWYRLSAEQGNAWAQFELGEMYQSGTGVIKDVVKAYMWVELSLDDESVVANGGKEFRDDLKSMLSPEEIAEAQSKSVELAAQIEAKLEEQQAKTEGE
jgi:TPR repeat protein